ncbi:MAG: phosphate propanoyltransferase [Clostridia bacterium]|nr:phosphate propanoyltransferase [Clostridia bacterium]
MDLNPGDFTPIIPQYISPYLQPLDVTDNAIPVGISARHIHLSRDHLDQLYGHGYDLKKYKDLYQPQQFAAQETLTLVGPKGVLEEVRILAPTRPQSQVEISRTDGYHLGINAPLKDSGDLNDTPGIVMVGPKGAVTLDKGVILAAAHIHLHTSEARHFGLKDGDRVQVLVDTLRDITFNNVLARVSDDYRLEFHLDTDEANAAFLKNGDKVFLVAKRLIQ